MGYGKHGLWWGGETHPPPGHKAQSVLQEDAQVVGLCIGGAEDQRHCVLDGLHIPGR